MIESIQYAASVLMNTAGLMLSLLAFVVALGIVCLAARFFIHFIMHPSEVIQDAVDSIPDTRIEESKEESQK